METLPIDGNGSYHRDVETHAVININNGEYEAYLRQREMMKNARANVNEVEGLKQEIGELKELVKQLLNRDSNGTSTPSK